MDNFRRFDGILFNVDHITQITTCELSDDTYDYDEEKGFIIVLACGTELQTGEIVYNKHHGSVKCFLEFILENNINENINA